jgi:hypothetical protein
MHQNWASWKSGVSGPPSLTPCQQTRPVNREYGAVQPFEKVSERLPNVFSM